jgi:hypothetical protein
MLTPNYSDILLVFLYGVMLTLFVQWVMDRCLRDNLMERVEWLEKKMYESSCRLLYCEEDINSCREEMRLVGIMRTQVELAKKNRPRTAPTNAVRRTRARSPRSAKK